MPDSPDSVAKTRSKPADKTSPDAPESKAPEKDQGDNAQPQQGNSPQDNTSKEPEKPSPLKNPAVRLGLIIAGVVILVILIIAGLYWWTHGRFVQSTNDAYLQADQVSVAPKVQGYVQKIFVTDNQMVHAGDALLQIDPSTYQATLNQQLATINARQADIAAAQRQVTQQSAALDQARAQLGGAQATSTYAASEAQRYRTLSAQGVETAERAAQAVNQSDQATAQSRADTAAVHQAQLQIATQQAQVGQARAQLAAAQAEAQTAQINVNDTLIRASVSGRIGDRTVRVGQFVQPGTRLMDVVPVQDLYLTANFKETQIGRMRIGQAATVKIDALDGRKIDAVIDSFAPGTGAQFALLPPENATGNFTKIVQRVPVRLRLVHLTQQDRTTLLPGLSATVKIDTTRGPVTSR